MVQTIPRLFLTRGLPGSGKSTWAKQMSKKYNNVILISRDDLRNSLYSEFSFGNKKAEDFVTIQQRGIIKNALMTGHDVIVHDTNLNISFMKQFKKHFIRYSNIFIVDFTDVPVEVCISRDELRMATKGFVGSDVINRMNKNWNKSVGKTWPFPIVSVQVADEILATSQGVRTDIKYIPDTTLADTVVLDIDGTLANIDHRSPFDHSKYHLDTLNKSVAKIAAGFTKAVILTGRDEEHYGQTALWLNKMSIAYDILFMRPKGDKRPDYIVKKEIFFDQIAPYYNVELVVEDRRQVVEMWRSIGLMCAQVDEGDF